MFTRDRRIRIVFFGTPGYAVPALAALTQRPDVEVALVVTQPDRPAGRGRQVQAPPVKAAAEAAGLPVYQPESLRTAESRAPLEAQAADLFVVAAYGLIFGRKTLALPRHGCLNLHASLLPKYRGASPATAAILAGDAESGVTLMRMDAGMDTGEIVARTAIPLQPDDTTATLTARLADVGARLLLETLEPWVSDAIAARPQPDEGASLVRPLLKSDGWIDWTRPAFEIERQIRALQPWPRAVTTLPHGTSLQLLSAELGPPLGAELPGTVRVRGKRVEVACRDGSLALLRVQPAGAGEMTALALVQGRRLADGDRLGADQPASTVGSLIRPVD